MDFQSTIMSAVVVIIMIAVVAFGFYDAKKKGLTFGDVINKFFLREGSTAVITLLFMMNVAEAITAATVHKLGGVHAGISINPITRFTMHLLMGIFSGFCAIYATKVILDLIKAFAKEALAKKPLYPFILFCELVIFLVVSIFGPYTNVYLISVGTEETLLFEAGFKQFMYFWKNNAQLGIRDPNWRAMDHMSPVLAVSLTLLLFHYLVALADAFIAIGDRYQYGLDVQEHEAKKKGYGTPPEPEKKKDLIKDPTKDSTKDDSTFLKEILDFMAISVDKRKAINDKCVGILATRTSKKDNTTRTGSLNKFKEEILKLKDISDDSNRSQRRRELKSEIEEFFKLKEDDGGFGFSITYF